MIQTNAEIETLKRRLAVHKRRMRYWACLPGIYGPIGKSLKKADEMYELACDDALNTALALERLTGTKWVVIDRKRTFQVRWSNPSAPEVMLS